LNESISQQHHHGQQAKPRTESLSQARKSLEEMVLNRPHPANILMLIIEHILLTKAHHRPRSPYIVNLEGDMIVDVTFKRSKTRQLATHMCYLGVFTCRVASIILPL
jgi:hypothetical protein